MEEKEEREDICVSLNFCICPTNVILFVKVHKVKYELMILLCEVFKIQERGVWFAFFLFFFYLIHIGKATSFLKHHLYIQQSGGL